MKKKIGSLVLVGGLGEEKQVVLREPQSQVALWATLVYKCYVFVYWFSYCLLMVSANKCQELKVLDHDQNSP